MSGRPRHPLGLDGGLCRVAAGGTRRSSLLHRPRLGRDSGVRGAGREASSSRSTGTARTSATPTSRRVEGGDAVRRHRVGGDRHHRLVAIDVRAPRAEAKCASWVSEPSCRWLPRSPSRTGTSRLIRGVKRWACCPRRTRRSWCPYRLVLARRVDRRRDLHRAHPPAQADADEGRARLNPPSWAFAYEDRFSRRLARPDSRAVARAELESADRATMRAAINMCGGGHPDLVRTDCGSSLDLDR